MANVLDIPGSALECAMSVRSLAQEAASPQWGSTNPSEKTYKVANFFVSFTDNHIIIPFYRAIILV